jgi:hypothetical protein
MATDGHSLADFPQIPDEIADAWAAVFIDVFEKLKARGELPQAEHGEGEPLCESTSPAKPT